MGMDIADLIFTIVAILLVIPLGIIVLPVAGIVLLIRWAWKRTHANGALPAGTKGTVYLEEGASKEAVVKVVSAYVEDNVLGPYAQGVLTTFEMAERRRDGIFSILRDEFSDRSLTWDKFSAPVEVAMEKIVSNASGLANHMQTFDSKEFQRMGRIERAGGYSDDRPEVERLKTMRSTLKQMDHVQEANDRILSELEHLQAELTTMAGAGYSTDTDEIIEEIRKLADDTQYYT